MNLPNPVEINIDAPIADLQAEIAAPVAGEQRAVGYVALHNLVEL